VVAYSPGRFPEPGGQHAAYEICLWSPIHDYGRMGYTRLSYMTIKGNNSFVWGEKEDIHVALNEDIIVEPVLPEPLNTRGHLGLKKKDHDRVLYLMVVISRLKFEVCFSLYLFLHFFRP
jgi:hypothetical protein